METVQAPRAVTSVCYSGFLGGPRSMGRVGEHFVAHLLSRNRYRVHFLPWANDFMELFWPPEIRGLITRQPADLGIDQSVAFCSVLAASQPHFARRTTPWLFYELASLPREHADDINTNDAVYVSSSFVRDVFGSHGVTVPMSVLGIGFDPRAYRFVERTRGEEFRFLCVAEHTPRKNLVTLVRAFERAFSETRDVRLIIKLGLHGEGDLRRHITRHDLITLRTTTPVVERELAAFYEAADCFVLPTRGEGFGMPMLEAMATGLPVIVTRWGGHLDFCTGDTAFLIDNRQLVDSDTRAFPGIASQWADPDRDHLIELMRQAYGNYDRALAVGRRGYEAVATDWTWERQLSRAFP